MESVSPNDVTLPISGDETAKFTTYSSAVHKVVGMVNAGLLQLISQQSSVLETHKAAFLYFCVFFLLYAVLLVREAIDEHERLQHGLVFPKFVGHASHLFGGLAALVLVSMVCAEFAIVLLLLWFIWLFAVVYTTLNELMIYMKANQSGTRSPQSSPV